MWRAGERASERTSTRDATHICIRVKKKRRTLSPVAREIRLIILSIWTVSLPERGRSRRVTWLRALERRSDTHTGRECTDIYLFHPGPMHTPRARLLLTNSKPTHPSRVDIDQGECRARINMAVISPNPTVIYKVVKK